MKIYLVKTHYTFPNEREIESVQAVYSTMDKAAECVQRLKVNKPTRAIEAITYLVYIDEYIVDQGD